VASAAHDQQLLAGAVVHSQQGSTVRLVVRAGTGIRGQLGVLADQLSGAGNAAAARAAAAQLRPIAPDVAAPLW
jgi:hypothetical protein